MSFVHEDPDFEGLVRIVADKRGLSVSLVEKDYWVTHTLWALLESGLEVWLKGGTSLSKGFSLIERFSEDLDLKVEPGRRVGVPAVRNWKSEGSSATRSREAFFAALAFLRADKTLSRPPEGAVSKLRISVRNRMPVAKPYELA